MAHATGVQDGHGRTRRRKALDVVLKLVWIVAVQACLVLHWYGLTSYDEPQLLRDAEPGPTVPGTVLSITAFVLLLGAAGAAYLWGRRTVRSLTAFVALVLLGGAWDEDPLRAFFFNLVSVPVMLLAGIGLFLPAWPWWRRAAGT